MKTFKEIFTRKTEKSVEATNVQLASGHNHAGTKYQCPMGCEGDKTYDSPGNCPVCNMKLVPLSASGSSSHEHEGHSHGHHGCC